MVVAPIILKYSNIPSPKEKVAALAAE